MAMPDFLDWEPADRLRYQRVDGEPRAMTPASPVHGLLQNELGPLIGNHLHQHRAGCRAIAHPGITPHVLSAQNVRIPDLGMTCAPVPRALVPPGPSTLPNPVLLIEMLSPENRAETWSNIWTYTSIPTVDEIMVVPTSRIAVEMLRRPMAGARSRAAGRNEPTRPWRAS